MLLLIGFCLGVLVTLVFFGVFVYRLLMFRW